MITKWTSHLKTQDEKDRFERTVRSARSVLERLNDILTEMEEILTSEEISTSSYERPQWAYKQADTNGYRRCIKHLQKLINLDQEKK